MNKKTVLILSLLAMIVFGVLIFLVNPVKTILSIQKVDNTPFYQMTYYGDYNLDSYLSRGIEVSARTILNGPRFACSTFVNYKDPKNPVFGRNFDWNHRQTLILFTDPPNGYKSVSLVDLSYLNVGLGELSINDKLNMFSSPGWSFDGMNESGVAISVSSVDFAQPSVDPNIPTIYFGLAIRAVLDYAGNVDEAIKIFNKYNMHFGNMPAHFQISDSDGKSIIVEFIDKKVSIVKSDTTYQICTNFIQSLLPAKNYTDDLRYNRLSTSLNNIDETISIMDQMKFLENVSMANTKWSVLYGLKSGQVLVSLGKRFEKIYDFKLEMNKN